VLFTAHATYRTSAGFRARELCGRDFESPRRECRSPSDASSALPLPFQRVRDRELAAWACTRAIYRRSSPVRRPGAARCRRIAAHRRASRARIANSSCCGTLAPQPSRKIRAERDDQLRVLEAESGPGDAIRAAIRPRSRGIGLEVEAQMRRHSVGTSHVSRKRGKLPPSCWFKKTAPPD
jgi:hypothetical protein